MAQIRITHEPSAEELDQLGVRDWPVWSKEVSEFPWYYDKLETCYILEGEIEVTLDGGEIVRLGVNDLAVFPQGMQCNWRVIKPVRKHYQFG